MTGETSGGGGILKGGGRRKGEEYDRSEHNTSIQTSIA